MAQVAPLIHKPLRAANLGKRQADYQGLIMAVTGELVETILIRCGRCCCVCRRFKPIHLQVHHIVPVSEGGRDELNNLTALCLTCHSDVHTKRPFTRRFTAQELKGHRDRVFELVEEGKLVPRARDVGALEEAPQVTHFSRVRELSASARGLDDTAIEVLVAAATCSHGILILSEGVSGASLHAGELSISFVGEARKLARYKHAVQQLERQNLIEDSGLRGRTQQVTHLGFLLADEVLAADAAGGT